MLCGSMDRNTRTAELDTLALRAFHEEPVPADTLEELQLACILMNKYPYPYKLEQGEDIQALVDGFCGLLVGRAAAVARGRTLFVTGRGAFGLGPYRVAEGDAVTILFGTQVPIILRPAQDAYTFIGDAYIESIMNGECMTEDYRELDFDII